MMVVQMGSNDVISLLYQLGHFFSPQALSVTLVEQQDLGKLTPQDEVVKAAIRSYQTYFKPDLDTLSLRAPEYGGHLHQADLDGELDQPTIDLLAMPRCGVPDFKHPNNASLEANWPDACRNDITSSYSMTLTGITASQLEQLWQEAHTTWETALQLKFRFLPQSYPNTRFWAVREAMSGSTLAYHYLATNNCNARLKGAYNGNVNWSPALLVTTIIHEHGHGLGFDHVQDNRATMYPSITNTSQARRGKPHETDLAEARRKGYSLRTTPLPPTPPTPPNPPIPPIPPGEGRMWISHRLEPGTYRILSGVPAESVSIPVNHADFGFQIEGKDNDKDNDRDIPKPT